MIPLAAQAWHLYETARWHNPEDVTLKKKCVEVLEKYIWTYEGEHDNKLENIA
jgi:hypothetical protein